MEGASVVLDVGCGRGKETVVRYRDRVPTSIGIDISDDIKFNDTINHRVKGSAYHIPIKTGSIDLVVCQELIEHLEHPQMLFEEASRVLKSGGVFILSTPNLLSWKSIISFLTPHKFHQIMNKQLHGIKEEDVFPTFYKMNTVSKIKKHLGENGLFVDKQLVWEGTPRTLTFSRLTTYIDILLTTVLRKYRQLEKFRELIIVCSRKERSDEKGCK
jgi:ubiquinone/menaquinone biosynthesis C-methylase UbiE